MCSNAKQMIHPTKDIKGVVLIVHGLNLNPKKMHDIGAIFKERKITPVYLNLTGHTKRSDWSKVTAKKWRDDLYKGLCQAFLISKDRNIPMYGFGYSLGSVLLQDAIERFKVPFEKTFHISPAFETRWYTGFVTALFKVGFEFNIPSSNFVEYRAKPNTSLLAYKAMWEINDGLKFNDKLEKIIFMDHRDEVVDFTSTKHLCNKIENCSFHELKNKPLNMPKSIYHLSIDPKTTGAKSWQFIRKSILSKI